MYYFVKHNVGNVCFNRILLILVFAYDKWSDLYRAFCAGSIITDKRVLTSAHCFLTNRKRRKHDFNTIKIAAGVLFTVGKYETNDQYQWRNMKHLYSQRLYRFPAYNLAILEVDQPWTFNEYVDKIPFTKWDQDFDGVCMGTTVKITKSWSENKELFRINLKMINNAACEYKLIRSTRLYYCTEYDIIRISSATETEGGGLICYGTGDPAEDKTRGVLVGVTSLIHLNLPTLHNRVGKFYKWVIDGCSVTTLDINILYFYILQVLHMLNQHFV